MRGDELDAIVKTPKGEMTLEYYCNQQYKRINLIMKLIEDEFGVSLITNHPELRHQILDISNYTKRLPQMITEGWFK